LRPCGARNASRLEGIERRDGLMEAEWDQSPATIWLRYALTTMRVLALYDIHGNLDALEAVLADQRATNPDAIVVGGDVVPGAFSSECLSLLRGQPVPVHWVRGNGEREVADAAARRVDAGTVPPGAQAELTAAITAAGLDADVAAWLGTLPTTVELDGVLYCHASPRRDDEMLTRISPAERWAEALDGVGQRLVLAGHTHQQDDRFVGGVRFVNAGSVGLPYEGELAARWAWIADGTPELRRTEYDGAAAGRRMLAAGWPDQRSIDASLIDPVDPMLVTRLFEGVD
jgi:predicted phosphodiesterase